MPFPKCDQANPFNRKKLTEGYEREIKRLE